MSQIIWTATDGKREHGASFYTNVPESLYNAAAPVLAAMAACQTVSQVSYQAADLYPASVQSIGGAANVLDSAVLCLSTARGATVRLVILGADPAIYLSDGETVNPVNPNIINLVGNCVGAGVSTRGGEIVQDYLRGYRIMIPAAPVYRY